MNKKARRAFGVLVLLTSFFNVLVAVAKLVAN